MTQTVTQVPTCACTPGLTNTVLPTVTMTIAVPITSPTVSPTITNEIQALKITDVVCFPCPYNSNHGVDLKINVKLNKVCETLKVRIYTCNYRRVYEAEIKGSFDANAQLQISASALNKLSNGVYYYIITGQTEQSEKAFAAIKPMILIR